LVYKYDNQLIYIIIDSIYYYNFLANELTAPR